MTFSDIGLGWKAQTYSYGLTKDTTQSCFLSEWELGYYGGRSRRAHRSIFSGKGGRGQANKKGQKIVNSDEEEEYCDYDVYDEEEEEYWRKWGGDKKIKPE